MAEARSPLRDAIDDAGEGVARSLAGVAAWDLVRLVDAKAAASALAELRPYSASLALRRRLRRRRVGLATSTPRTVANALRTCGYELEAAEACSAASTIAAKAGKRREAAALAQEVEAFRSHGEGVLTRLLVTAAEPEP